MMVPCGSKQLAVFSVILLYKYLVRFLWILLVLCDDLFMDTIRNECRSQWPRGLRRRSSVARLLRLWVRIPREAWMFVCCECCVLSGRGLYDGLITRTEDSYRLWRVVVCDLETSKTRRLKPPAGLWKYNHSGLWRQETNKQQQTYGMNIMVHTEWILWYKNVLCL
jgi:hypothetical protein